MQDLIISQERLEELVTKEIENQFIKNPQLFEKLVLSIIKNKLSGHLDNLLYKPTFNVLVENQMNALFESKTGYFYTEFTRVLNKIFVEKLTLTNYYFERIISNNVYKYIQNNSNIQSFIEPLITEVVLKNNDFLTYVKNSVDNKLSAKLKKLNNLISGKITDTLVQTHIQDYLKMRKDITQEDLKDVE